MANLCLLHAWKAKEKNVFIPFECRLPIQQLPCSIFGDRKCFLFIFFIHCSCTMHSNTPFLSARKVTTLYHISATCDSRTLHFPAAGLSTIRIHRMENIVFYLFIVSTDIKKMVNLRLFQFHSQFNIHSLFSLRSERALCGSSPRAHAMENGTSAHHSVFCLLHFIKFCFSR